MKLFVCFKGSMAVVCRLPARHVNICRVPMVVAQSYNSLAGAYVRGPDLNPVFLEFLSITLN